MRLHDAHKSESAPQRGARGLFSLWDCREHGPILVAQRRNQIQSGFGLAAAKMFGFGYPHYRVRYMYIEFENVGDPDDTVAIPTYDKGDGREYYDDLELTGSRDYLRVPLMSQPKLRTVSGFEAYFNATNEEGNGLTFFAMTQGSAGVNGKDFGNAVNSKIIGGALVASPDLDTPANDLIIARTYVEAADQFVKPTANHVGVTWDLDFLF